jgi:hypothetical protein
MVIFIYAPSKSELHKCNTSRPSVAKLIGVSSKRHQRNEIPQDYAFFVAPPFCGTILLATLGPTVTRKTELLAAYALPILC